MLAVGQTLAVTSYLAELTASAAVESPPDANGHAVLQAYHGLAHVVHLVGISHLAVLRQPLKETCVGRELACQLVGVAPVVVILA